jgi:hypothetical protein
MKLDDVLAMAGDHPLSEFPWGASAVLLMNSIAVTEDQIDVNHTGKQAYEKLRRLSSATLLCVLTREVSVIGNSVEFVPSQGEAARGVPVTVPVAPSKRMSPMAAIIMVVLSIIGMALTFSTVQQAQKTGQPQDNAALTEIVKTMAEILKSETSPQNPATPASP